jgi:hypothetical protein
VKESFSFFAALIAIHRDTGLPPEFTSRKLKDARLEVYERADIFEEVYGDQHSKFGPDRTTLVHLLRCRQSETHRAKELDVRSCVDWDERRMSNKFLVILKHQVNANIRFYESVGYKVVSTCVLEDTKKTSSVSCVGMVRQPQPIGRPPIKSVVRRHVIPFSTPSGSTKKLMFLPFKVRVNTIIRI